MLPPVGAHAQWNEIFKSAGGITAADAIATTIAIGKITIVAVVDVIVDVVAAVAKIIVVISVGVVVIEIVPP